MKKPQGTTEKCAKSLHETTTDRQRIPDNGSERKGPPPLETTFHFESAQCDVTDDLGGAAGWICSVHKRKILAFKSQGGPLFQWYVGECRTRKRKGAFSKSCVSARSLCVVNGDGDQRCNI